MKLNNSPVKFDEFAHTYTLNGKLLSGVTSLLHRQMFADKYAGVDELTLAQAADYGSSVHQLIELHDSLGVADDDEVVQWYEQLKQDNKLQSVANEYLISDNEYIASSIDIVFDDCSLCDIKTTATLDMDYLSWQLSIYAYLFERQNPTLKVPALWAIWLPRREPERRKMIQVARISDECIEALIAADKAGDTYTPPLLDRYADKSLAAQQDAIQAVISIEKQMKAMEQQYNALKKGLLEKMQELHVKSFKADGFSLTVKAASTSARVDSALLKERYPQIYEEVCKTSRTKESLIIKVS